MLGTTAKFYTPAPPAAATRQLASLKKAHASTASGLAELLATPHAVTLGPSSPASVERTAAQTLARAARADAVPVFVTDALPGAGCRVPRSHGGDPTSPASYATWVRSLARGIGLGKAVVVLEPGSLTELPSVCRSQHPGLARAYPVSDTQRFEELSAAVAALERVAKNTSVYLDGGSSRGLGVGQLAADLVQAGVAKAQGFAVGVGASQYTANEVAYGTWVSQCIAWATDFAQQPQVPGGGYACPSQYSNWGAGGTMIATLEGGSGIGVPLSPYGVWSDRSTIPDDNTSGLTTRFRAMLGGLSGSTHFVVDTAETGHGPDPMTEYAQEPYVQPPAVIRALTSGASCNPVTAGLGPRPTSSTGNALVDAYLWTETPGTSDGRCSEASGARAWDYDMYSPHGWPTSAGARRAFDPLWGQVDPPAGAWFPAEALRLIGNAAGN